ncbi:hypothetical protein NUACC21_81950 [Scytonema sp. NUACC21]
MFLLTINAFGILWAAIQWGIAGVCAALLVLLPVFIISVSLSNSDNIAQRITAFVVSGIILIAILIGGHIEYDKQLKEQNKSSHLLTQKSVSLHSNIVDLKT